VDERKHSRKKDAECLCLCTFILSWLHGPNEGKLTAAEIGDICIVQPIKEHDPAVALFLEITRRRLESQSGQELVVICHKGIKTKTKMGFFERMQKVSSGCVKCIFMFPKYFPLFCMLRNL
jgi:hypothetical protein